VLEAGIRHDRVEPTVSRKRGVDDESVPLAGRQVGVVDVHAVHSPPVRAPVTSATRLRCST
jgi:hypothetical protein